jgi:predicted PurR-regulated permease PerM
MSNGPDRPPSRPQRPVQWVILLAAAAIVAYLCLLILLPFLNVLAWSSVLAIAFHPVHSRLAAKIGRPSLSAFLSSLLVVVMIFIPLLFLSGLAVNQFVALRSYLQENFKEGFDVSAIGPLRRVYEWLATRLGVDARQVMDWLSQNASEVGRVTATYSLTLAANLSGLVVSFIFTIFAVFLMLRDGHRIVGRIPDLLPFERARSEEMMLRIRDVIYASVYGVLVIAGIQGVLTAFMFALLAIPSPALWGMVTVITSVLPLVGSAAVWVPGVVYLVLKGEWPSAIVLIAWGGLVIGMVDNFLRPRLVGGRVGLSELTIFFALLGGLQVFGLLGIVLGPVLFAVAASMVDVLSERESTPTTPAGSP